MRQTRKGVFETNSSSTHSICIVKCKQSELDKPEKLVFRPGEFGWEFCRYTTPEYKASYLYTAILQLYSPVGASAMLNKIYQRLYEEGVEAEFKEPHRNGRYDFMEDGDIDHVEDAIELVEALVGNKNRLMRYLFSDKSFILTGNDNDGRGVDICVPYDHEEFYKGN